MTTQSLLVQHTLLTGRMLEIRDQIDKLITLRSREDCAERARQQRSLENRLDELYTMERDLAARLTATFRRSELQTSADQIYLAVNNQKENNHTEIGR